ncbi:hypothetical protein V6N13_118526 [Hibiscus sabdariffa]|uniref:Uncharacterized protein n=1 Tax=Hibiscus sabdariffa TaxID=183260 RepID=A0ABR2BS80_9ROSI
MRLERKRKEVAEANNVLRETAEGRVLQDSPVRKSGNHELILSSPDPVIAPYTGLVVPPVDFLLCKYGLHVSGVAYAPLQQYSGFPNAPHALLQASPDPTLNSFGHCGFKSLAHPVDKHVPDPPLGSTIIGKLYPSTKLTS